MKFIDQLEQRYGRFAVKNLTMFLIAAQCIGLAMSLTMRDQFDKIPLQMSLVKQGEFWRLGTFFFMPVTDHPLFFFFGAYLFYLMGTTLEANWGDFRFNLYILIATLGTYVAGLIFPDQPLTNAFIDSSVFLAFAYLYPGFVIMMFFILPVQIKWLALLTWLGYGYTLLFLPWPAKAMVLAAVANFFLFFGHEIFWRAYHHKRRMEWNARMLAKRDTPFHNCVVCGATERSHPKMDFRYCTKCEGSYEYCADHLRTHEHIVKSAPAEAADAGKSDAAS